MLVPSHRSIRRNWTSASNSHCPRSLPFFWSSGYSPSSRPVRTRQPPSWMKDFVCFVFSHVSNMFRVNTCVCFKRHSSLQLDTWTLAVRYYKAYYYVEGVWSIPEVTLSSRVRVQDHLLCMIRHLVIQSCWVVGSSMCLLPYGVTTLRIICYLKTNVIQQQW